MNNTINPPRKIRNKMYENHLILIFTHPIMHKIEAWVKISVINNTGCEFREYNILVNIEAIDMILIPRFNLKENISFGN